jgi:hypothetical protein
MLIITKNGKKNIAAIILGNIKNDAELTPIISKASICSLTLILPISDAMLDSIESAEDVFGSIAREDVVNVDIALDYEAIEYDVSTDVKSVLDNLFGTHD